MAKKTDIMFVDKIEMIPVEKLKGWDRNPRINDSAVDPVAESIKQYGMLVPILINKKNEIIAGNTRLKSCVKAGLKKIPCVRGDHLTQEQQIMYNIADNKLSEIATWDHDMLKEIMAEVSTKFEGQFNPTAIGFQQAEYDLMFKGWHSNAGRMGDVESDDSTAPGKIVIQCKTDDEDSLRENLQQFINSLEFTEVLIK